MTQPKKEHSPEERQKRSKEPGRQALLPLAPKNLHSGVPQSKLIFQLKSELHRLQQRDKEWKLMFNMLSHDLKEPILTLEGFTKLLTEPGLHEKDQTRYLAIVREAVSSLHQLIGSLQSIARLAQDPHDFTIISMNELFQSVLTSLSQQIEKSRARIVLPSRDLVVKSDAVRLFQVFLNLLANSLKYHKSSAEVSVTIAYRRTREFYRISIKDNGIGIDPKDLKRIFLPFTRLEDVQTDGMGIGLSIVKRIAESLKGKVLVRSKQNIGTIFTVCLPRGARL